MFPTSLHVPLPAAETALTRTSYLVLGDSPLQLCLLDRDDIDTGGILQLVSLLILY